MSATELRADASPLGRRMFPLMFDYDLTATLGLFTRYLELARAKRSTEVQVLLAAEAYERLEQLHFLLRRIATIQRHILSGSQLSSSDFLLPIEPSPAGSDTGLAIRDAFFHVRLLTESFYYLAFRFRQILKVPNKLTGNYALPLLKSFEASGVRDVRNHLVEHPEGPSSQRFSQDHSLGGASGPQLKLDAGATGYPDAGLFANAADFKRELEKSLSAAVTTLEAE